MRRGTIAFAAAFADISLGEALITQVAPSLEVVEGPRSTLFVETGRQLAANFLSTVLAHRQQSDRGHLDGGRLVDPRAWCCVAVPVLPNIGGVTASR